MNDDDREYAPRSANGSSAAPAGLHARLAQRLEGLWPAVSGHLADIGDADTGAATLPVPAEPDALTAPLRRFGGACGDGDRRAVVSLWGQWWLGLSWPPLLVAALDLGVLPTVGSARLRLATEGRPAALELPDDGVPGGPEALLETLVRAHTAPMVAALAAAGGFSPRVLWNVAGAFLHWTVTELADRGDAPGLAPARRLLTRPEWPDGRGNPLCGTRAPPPAQRRRVCCLRFRLEDFPYCGDCPITARGTRD